MKLKQFIIAALTGLVVAACTIDHPTIPKGYKTCITDWDCERHEYCGFKEINTYAVCLRKPYKFQKPDR